MEGFFKAPVTGKFRFLTSCDDSCKLKLNVDEPLEPSTAVQLLSRGCCRSYRDTDIEDKSDTSSELGVSFSDWVYLT